MAPRNINSTFFCKNCLFGSSYTLSGVPTAYEAHLTENGLPPEPNMFRLYSLYL